MNDAYEISYKHALELIEINGGEVTEKHVNIKKEEAKEAPLEQSFEGYQIHERRSIDKKISYNDDQHLTTNFEWVVLRVLFFAEREKQKKLNKAMKKSSDRKRYGLRIPRPQIPAL